MAKTTSRRIPFGAHLGGPIHVIETQVSRNYRRRAIIGFFVVGATVGLLAATVISH